MRENFKNDYSQPFELTDGQADIFNAIFLKNHNRVEVIASTQYGKSDTVAMAILLRGLHKQEDFAVIAGRKDKAQIIMARVLQHVFDNEVFYKQLELDANMPLDRLRKERSKDHIIWRHGGGVRTFSAGTSSRKMLFDSLTGFGCIKKGESILTENGYIEISKIVREKLNIRIASYSHNKKSVEFKRILSHQKNPRGKRYFLEINTGDKKFICTNDHPIYIKNKGYIRADEVKQGDKVIVLDS